MAACRHAPSTRLGWLTEVDPNTGVAAMSLDSISSASIPSNTALLAPKLSPISGGVICPTGRQERNEFYFTADF
jgi:hypothetical protein